LKTRQKKKLIAKIKEANPEVQDWVIEKFLFLQEQFEKLNLVIEDLESKNVITLGGVWKNPVTERIEVAAPIKLRNDILKTLATYGRITLPAKQSYVIKNQNNQKEALDLLGNLFTASEQQQELLSDGLTLEDKIKHSNSVFKNVSEKHSNHLS